MHTTATHHKLVVVDVLDSIGEPMGRSVAVEVFYITEGPYTYGEDADGRRGEQGCYDTTVLDMYLNPCHHLNSEQVEQVLGDARRMVEKGTA